MITRILDKIFLLGWVYIHLITLERLWLHYLAIDLLAQLTISAARMRLCVVLPELWMFMYSAVNMAFSIIPRRMTPPIQN